LQPQVRELGGGQLEHEISREPIHVSAYSEVEVLGRNLVRRREIAIEHGSLPANDDDPVRDDRGAELGGLPASHGGAYVHSRDALTTIVSAGNS
jgi:hypothetical protein